MVSFADYKEIEVMKGGGYMGAGGYLAKEMIPAGKKWFQFDQNGEVTHVAKNDEEWVSIVGDYKSKGDLADIYSQSGKTVQGLIEKANQGTPASYDSFSSSFYKNQELTKNAARFFTESYQTNFLNLNGENLAVGGSGKIKLDLTIYEPLNNLKIYFLNEKGDRFRNHNIFYISCFFKQLVYFSDSN